MSLDTAPDGKSVTKSLANDICDCQSSEPIEPEASNRRRKSAGALHSFEPHSAVCGNGHAPTSPADKFGLNEMTGACVLVSQLATALPPTAAQVNDDAFGAHGDQPPHVN